MPTNFAKLFLVAICCIVSLTAATPPDPKPLILGPPIADIPIIHTGKELLKLDSINAGDRDFYAGIQRTSCDLGEGALVYVAFHNQNLLFDPPTIQTLNQTAIGPYILEIEPAEKIPFVDPQIEFSKKKLANLFRRQDHLFVATVQPRSSGKYIVRIKSPAGDTLAKTEFTVTDKPAHPWLPLVRTGPRTTTGDKQEIACKITTRHVAPDWSGDDSILLPEDDLPTFFPTVETADLKFKADGDHFELTGENISSVINENYMARVWINDKPVRLNEIERQKETQQLEEVRRADPLSLKLHINFSELGAKEGDQLTLQLAYSPCGTKEVEIGAQLKQMTNKMSRKHDEEDKILLTKKVTIKLTKESVAPLKESVEQAQEIIEEE